MKARRIRLAVILFSAAAMLSGTITPAAAHSGRPGTRPHHRVHTHPAGVDWHQRDRAVYVVSTLNAVVCSSGDQLSAALWRKYNARAFDVFGSSLQPNLYFIQVKDATGKLLSVYAYVFGWKLPRGVENGVCVRPAPTTIMALYNPAEISLIAEFHTTFPR